MVAQVQKGSLDILLLSHIFQLFLGDIPRLDKTINPSSVFLVCSVVSTSWRCPVCPQWELPWMHSGQMPEPPELSSFDAKKQQLQSKVPLDVQTHPIFKAKPGHKLILAACLNALILSVTRP